MGKERLKEIDSKFVMRGSPFGIWFDLRPHLPEGCNNVEIYVIINDKKESLGIYLPHQLYLNDLIEKTKNGKYEIYFKPYFPEFEAIPIFKQSFKELGEKHEKS